MAHVWFSQLSAMEKKGLKISDLKRDLEGNTLIGEYIGSQEHQHLVKYSRVTLIFYAIVSNSSDQDCWPCEQSWALFDKYGFDRVIIQSLGKFTNYGKLCDTLCQVFKDVAKSEIAQEEEGNVLYFVKRPSSGQSVVLSLCKLKTLEYRLFRKMREKLRNFHSTPDQTEENRHAIEGKFRREARELADEHELPRSLDYYIALFKAAFDFIKSDRERNTRLLNEEYVTFSEQLLKYFTSIHKDSTFAQNSNFFFSPVLDKQHEISYGKGYVKE